MVVPLHSQQYGRPAINQPPRRDFTPYIYFVNLRLNSPTYFCIFLFSRCLQSPPIHCHTTWHHPQLPQPPNTAPPHPLRLYIPNNSPPISINPQARNYFVLNPLGPKISKISTHPYPQFKSSCKVSYSEILHMQHLRNP